MFDASEDFSGCSDETVHDLGAVTASILAALEVPVPHYMPAPVPALVRALGGDAPGSDARDRAA